MSAIYPDSGLELVLGGARSGKSRLAEQRALEGGHQLFYIATATADDSEMATRIRHHQSRRGNHWQLIEAPLHLADTLRALQGPDRCLLVDCLTLWLSNCLHHQCWPAERDALLKTVGQLQGRVILVSNEVGSGIVPMGELSRQFVDESGWLHQQLAQVARRVTLVVAGLPLEFKDLGLTSDPMPPWLNQPVAPPSQTARDAAVTRQTQLTKPPGSLGRLEDIAIAFAGWQGTALPTLDHCRVRVFAADHGIAAEGVSAFPQAVTVEMIRNFAQGGAAISVLSRLHGADFAVVNLGTAHPLSEADRTHPAIRHRHLAPGSANICTEPAMDCELLAAALQAGANEIRQPEQDGAKPQLFIGGEMGIGNTAATAALTSALLDLPVAISVGTGTGIDDQGLVRKRDAVSRALALHLPFCTSPLETLRRLGGLEIAALTGAYIAAAQAGIPSLVDGYICTAAALLACRINPGVRDWLLFAHLSQEPGHLHLLDALDAQPLLDLGLRLGEGSGAAAALPLLTMACALHSGMATFAEAGVSGNE